MGKRSTHGASSQTRVQPVRDASGRIVAGVRPDGTLQKDVSGSRHFLRRPPAICFDLAVLDAAEALGAGPVEVRDLDTGRLYRSTIAEIRARGFAVNRGWGPQWALALACWRGDAQPAAEQLALFA